MAAGTKVSFYAGDGARIAGLLWIPKGVKEGERRPAVVVARGFGAVKEFVNPGFAEVMNRDGYVMLGFDYRGIGESEGIPGRVIPMQQVDDIRSAITFLQTVPQVDPDKIGLLGESMGGAHVIYTAAHDKRVKCVISSSGPGDLDRWYRGLVGYEKYLGWKARIEEDRRTRTLTGRSTYVSAYDFLAFSAEERAAWAGFEKELPGIHPDVPMETVEKYLEYKPEQFVHQISPRPVFFITAETSVIVPPDEIVSLYEKAKDPKKLWIMPRAEVPFRYATHQKGHGYSKPLAAAYMDWFKEWIPVES